MDYATKQDLLKGRNLITPRKIQNELPNDNSLKSKREKDKQSVRIRERRFLFLFLFFLLFVSFLDLWKSDNRFLSEQKAKLVYATRATRRYQKLSIPSNSKR